MGASGGFAGERLSVAHLDGCRSVVVGHPAVFDVNARHAVGCGRHDVVVVKTQVAGRAVKLSVPVLCGGLAAQSQVPFADGCGGVSRPVHEVGHGGLFRSDDHAGIACRHVRPGSAEGILPCEQGVARGGGGGGAGVHVGESHAVARQAVDRGSLDAGGTVARKVAISQVVGHEKNDIGFHVLCPRREGQEGE